MNQSKIIVIQGRSIPKADGTRDRLDERSILALWIDMTSSNATVSLPDPEIAKDAPRTPMTRLEWIAVGPALLALAACASAPTPSVTWTGGDPARLAADQAACQTEASQLDVNQSATYSDPRYGVTSAMAAQVGRDNPLMDQKAAVRAATVATCMSDKGWKPQ